MLNLEIANNDVIRKNAQFFLYISLNPVLQESFLFIEFADILDVGGGIHEN